MGKHVSLAGTATVGPKGQVVIPADVREKMGITHGDKLVVLYMSEKNAVGFITEDQAQELINKMGENLQAMQGALKKQ